MQDGLALDHLRVEGVPVGRWWQNIQDRYAKAYGTRYLTDYKTRKDKGVPRPHLRITRDGKETMTQVKRQRAEAVSLKPPLLQGGESPTNVFGHKPLRAAQLLELCRNEESKKFKELLVNAQKKAQKRQQEVDDLHLAREPGSGSSSRKPRRCFRLAALPARKREKLMKAYAKRKARSTNSCFAGVKISWEEVHRKMGRASPVVVVEDVDRLPGRGLREDFGGRPLGDYVVQLEQFMAEVHPLRRVILVNDIGNIPWCLHLVVATLGAGLQEQMSRPLLRYRMMKECVVTFTTEFAQAQKGVLRAARLLSQRSERTGGRSATEGKASFRWQRRKDFASEVKSLLRQKGGKAV